MSANILTMEDFEAFQRKLFKMIESTSSSQEKEYITKQECFEKYAIKERTLTELKKDRRVTFSKVGNTHIYKHSSIIEYIEKNQIEAVKL
jgi:hypothetical protein